MNSISIPDYVKSYKDESERLKMKQFFIDNLYKLDINKKSILFSTPLIFGGILK